MSCQLARTRRRPSDRVRLAAVRNRPPHNSQLLLVARARRARYKLMGGAMAKLDLALVVRTVDQATRPLRNIQRAVRQVGRSTGLDQVARNARVVGRRFNAVGREAGQLVKRIGLIGLAAGAAGLAFGQKYANAADQIAKTSARVGLGAEELQRLRHAFDIGGVSADKTDKALLYFTRSIGDAADGTGESVKIFEAMGISLKDAQGQLRPMRDLLDEVSVAFQNQESVEKKGIAAQYLFGRAGQLMLNTLSDGPDAIRALGDEAESYGLISQTGRRGRRELYRPASRAEARARRDRHGDRRATDSRVDAVGRRLPRLGNASSPRHRDLVQDGARRSDRGGQVVGRSVGHDERRSFRCGGLDQRDVPLARRPHGQGEEDRRGGQHPDVDGGRPRAGARREAHQGHRRHGHSAGEARRVGHHHGPADAVVLRLWGVRRRQGSCSALRGKPSRRRSRG